MRQKENFRIFRPPARPPASYQVEPPFRLSGANFHRRNFIDGKIAPTMAAAFFSRAASRVCREPLSELVAGLRFLF
jgi:hypothetical protein